MLIFGSGLVCWTITYVCKCVWCLCFGVCKCVCGVCVCWCRRLGCMRQRMTFNIIALAVEFTYVQTVSTYYLCSVCVCDSHLSSSSPCHSSDSSSSTKHLSISSQCSVSIVKLLHNSLQLHSLHSSLLKFQRLFMVYS